MLKTGSYYEVTVTDNCWRCTCPYHVHGNRRCRHIGAVQPLVERIRRSERDAVSICDPGAVCVSCGGDDCRHRETRRRKWGVSERYECRTCGKKFTYNPGFVGRHYNPADITGALEDVAMGKSSEQAAQSLAKTGRIPDPATVRRWTRSFGSPLKKMTDSIAHRVGCQRSADELYFKSMGRGMWLFGVMDTETRFVMDYDVSPNKMGYDATNLLAGAVELAGKIPNAVTTDAPPGSASGLRRALPGGRRAGTLHRKDAGIRKRHYSDNNTCERLTAYTQGPPEIRPRIPLRAARSSHAVPGVLPPLRAPFGHGRKDARRGAGRHTEGARQAADGHTARGPARCMMPGRAAVGITGGPYRAAVYRID